VCGEKEETAEELHRVDVGLPRCESFGSEFDGEPKVG
jgi:hypothetical protein